MTTTFELQEAARDHKVLTVRNLVKTDPKSVFEKDLDGRVALHWAASSDDKEIVSILLNPSHISNSKIEVDVDELLDDAGWTPFHIASAIGDIDVLELFVDHEPSPDLNLPTGQGQTVLHLAVSKGHAEAVNYLLDHGASARVSDKKKQYPIHRAAAMGSIKMVDILAKKGRSPLNSKDSSGLTPLHLALAEGHGDVGIELVKLGADPEITDSQGATAVDSAVDRKVAEYFTHHLGEI